MDRGKYDKKMFRSIVRLDANFVKNFYRANKQKHLQKSDTESESDLNLNEWIILQNKKLSQHSEKPSIKHLIEDYNDYDGDVNDNDDSDSDDDRLQICEETNSNSLNNSFSMPFIDVNENEKPKTTEKGVRIEWASMNNPIYGSANSHVPSPKQRKRPTKKALADTPAQFNCDDCPMMCHTCLSGKTAVKRGEIEIIRAKIEIELMKMGTSLTVLTNGENKVYPGFLEQFAEVKKNLKKVPQKVKVNTLQIKRQIKHTSLPPPDLLPIHNYAPSKQNHNAVSSSHHQDNFLPLEQAPHAYTEEIQLTQTLTQTFTNNNDSVNLFSNRQSDHSNLSIPVTPNFYINTFSENYGLAASDGKKNEDNKKEETNKEEDNKDIVKETDVFAIDDQDMNTAEKNDENKEIEQFPDHSRLGNIETDVNADLIADNSEDILNVHAEDDFVNETFEEPPSPPKKKNICSLERKSILNNDDTQTISNPNRFKPKHIKKYDAKRQSPGVLDLLFQEFGRICRIAIHGECHGGINCNGNHIFPDVVYVQTKIYLMSHDEVEKFSEFCYYRIPLALRYFSVISVYYGQKKLISKLIHAIPMAEKHTLLLTNYKWIVHGLITSGMDAKSAVGILLENRRNNSPMANKNIMEIILKTDTETYFLDILIKISEIFPEIFNVHHYNKILKVAVNNQKYIAKWDKLIDKILEKHPEMEDINVELSKKFLNQVKDYYMSLHSSHSH